MNCNYKGVMLKDKSSKRYKVFKVIDKHYGCLGRFLDDIELKLPKAEMCKR